MDTPLLSVKIISFFEITICLSKFEIDETWDFEKNQDGRK